MPRAATRDKDPISTSRSRKGHAASPPPPTSANILIRYLRWKAARPSRLILVESAFREAFRIHSILFYVSYLSDVFSFYSPLSYLYFYSILDILFRKN